MNLRTIFIGGCDRSGTTLLAKRLHEHGLGLAISESSYKRKWFAGESRISRLISPTYKYPRGLRERLRCYERVSLLKILRTHAEVQYKEQLDPNSACVLIDHTPNNLLIARELRNEFEGCFVLGIVRDPRATFASMRKVSWGIHNPYAFARYWAGYGQALTDADAIVRYEDLVENPAGVMAQIQKLLSEHGFRSPPRNANLPFPLLNFTRLQHRLVESKSMDRRRLGAWRRELKSRHVTILEGITGELLSRYGYQGDAAIAREEIGVVGLSSEWLEMHLFRVVRLKRTHAKRLFEFLLTESLARWNN